jgi:two-component system chemotaxis sensor kinase CheA
MNNERLRQAFFEEARTLLEDMETYILLLENGNADGDTVHALFRCAHTIKGSAGIFGFDAIVSFTHVVESVLDRLRTNQLPFDSILAALLLDCRDHVATLLDAVAAPDASDELADQARGGHLIDQLNICMGQIASPASLPVPAASAAASIAISHEINEDSVESEAWHVSLRFHRDAFRRGINPAAFIVSLGDLGELRHVQPLLDNMPEAAEMDPESCYYGFEIVLQSGCSRLDIETALEFLDGDCEIRIIPPRARIAEYRQLIQAQNPAQRLRLGEILVGAGALTQRELEHALQQQAETAVDSSEPPQPLGQILADSGVVTAPLVREALDQQRRSDERQKQVSKVLKVPSERVDQLIDLVGELVIASSSLQTMASARGDGKALEGAATLHELIEEIRDISLRMRMVPIGDSFSRFQRAVRDIARELGKDIELVISGGETELDKSMVELIGDPLMHLVRNAADHGIEAPALRESRGKPARGRLRLNAYHDSGSVVIEVSDDGSGLDRDRIRRKAIERGLISADQLLEDGDIYRLIFEPGFSTAEAVTNLSGRGVGMDVVKKNIEALRGTIDIDSTPGAGTCMRLRLPLTLAIIDGFLVELARASYVLPLDLVVECRDLSNAERSEAQERGFINLRGSALPVIDVRTLFGLGGYVPPRCNIVVVNYGGQSAGLVVDRLFGQSQVVIKPLPDFFRQLRGISGSTILGDGRVAPILDIPGLLQMAAAPARSGIERQPTSGRDASSAPLEQF